MDRLIHKIEQEIARRTNVVEKEQTYTHDDILGSTSDCEHCSPNYEWGLVQGMKDILAFIKSK